MKRPTITKKQAIEAMIAQAKADRDAAHAAHNAKVTKAEAHLHALVRAITDDPLRLSALTRVTPVDLGDEADDDIHDVVVETLASNLTLKKSGRYRNQRPLELVIQITDPEVLAAQEVLDKLQRSYPPGVNENDVRAMLEDKLTGCDPESLLSVPENVATIRALLNGLQLLPESYEALSA